MLKLAATPLEASSGTLNVWFMTYEKLPCWKNLISSRVSKQKTNTLPVTLLLGLNQWKFPYPIKIRIDPIVGGNKDVTGKIPGRQTNIKNQEHKICQS